MTAPAPAAGIGYKTDGSHGKVEGVCCQCKLPMGRILGTTCDEGPIHNDCVANYRRKTTERCGHCRQPLERERIIFKDKKFHPASWGSCLEDHKAGRVWEPPAHSGYATKLAVGRSKFFGSQNWKQRYFVINQKTGGLLYFENEEAFRTAKPMKNMVTISNTTRMITKPTCFIHPKAENPSKELIIIFQEQGKEYQLLMRCDSWESKDKWEKTLKAYIQDVDLPPDLVEKYKRG